MKVNFYGNGDFGAGNQAGKKAIKPKDRLAGKRMTEKSLALQLRRAWLASLKPLDK
jgi:hypothetical protein